MKSQHIGKDPDAGKDWGQEKRVTGDEMVGRYHWLSGQELEQTLGDSEGQGSLACCSPLGWKEADITEQLNNNNKKGKRKIQRALTPGLLATPNRWSHSSASCCQADSRKSATAWTQQAGCVRSCRSRWSVWLLMERQRFCLFVHWSSLKSTAWHRCCAMLSCSVVSNSSRPRGWQPTSILCPWGFSRQEFWSGLPCPPPGDLPNPGIKPRSPALRILYHLSHQGGEPAWHIVDTQ